MSQSLSTMVRDGQHYMQLWPDQRALYALFPESRVIAATRFSMKVMPPLSVLTAALFIHAYGFEYLPQAIAMAAFFLSLPFQGLIWLGHRSNQLLPPSTRAWYKEIHAKMQAEGCSVQGVKSNPRYVELARLLRTAFDELDKVFTKQWF